MAETQTAWVCSQCGTVNEAGARKCSGCGKWPSLFDLQNTVDEAPVAADEFEELELEPFDPELFEPETFEPESYESESFEPVTLQPQPSEPETEEPGPFEQDEDEEEESGRRRLRRYAISVIWVIGIIVWLVANAFGDR